MERWSTNVENYWREALHDRVSDNESDHESDEQDDGVCRCPVPDEIGNPSPCRACEAAEAREWNLRILQESAQATEQAMLAAREKADEEWFQAKVREQAEEEALEFVRSLFTL